MQIRLTLLSDTLSGSGEGMAGVIDTDSTFDEYGFPFIPAKRIKGIIKESALDYLEALNGTDPSEKIEALFGKSGSDFTESLKLTNGYLENYAELKDLMAKIYALDETQRNKYLAFFNSENIRRQYSCNRIQTTIERKTKTAKDDTLRQFRVLKNGLSFLFDLNFLEEPDKDKIKLLENACKVTRHMGLSRTRGLGDVRLELLNVQGDPARPNNNNQTTTPGQGSDIVCLPYIINTEAQLIASLKVGGNNVVSESYIPGGLILGAFAGNYIRQPKKRQSKKISYGNAHKDDNFRRLFLEGKVQYTNAYLTDIDCKKLLPVPGSFVQKKDDDIYYDLAWEDDWETVTDVGDIQTQKLSEHFCMLKNDENEGSYSILSLNPAKEMEYHHQRPKDRSIGHASEDKDNDDDGNFFQFEVLKKDQCFKGMITGSSNDLAKLQKIIPDKSTVHLGKSRTAQYGNAKISYEAAAEFTGEIPKKNGIINKDNSFVITLTAPMILQNDIGHYLPDPNIFLNELKKRLNITGDAFLKISDTANSSFLRFIKIGGFMAKWGLPRQQATALDAGSVIICQYTGDTDISIFDIEKNGYGERVEQGFGRVIVDWHGWGKIQAEKFEIPEGTINFPPCFKKTGVQIIRQQLEMWVKEKAIDTYDSIKKSYTDEEILTNSLIGRLMTIFSNCASFNDINTNILSFKDKANKKLKALNLEIGAVQKPLHYWLESFCNDTGAEFNDKIIAQTKITDLNIRNILGELHITDTDTDIIEHFKLVKSFFIMLFKCFVFHNRGLDR